MKLLLRLAGLVAVLIGVTAQDTEPVRAQAATGTLQGTVVIAGTSTPLPDAQIAVTIPATRSAQDAQARDPRATPAPPAPLTAVTDASGHFSLVVPEGSATVRAQLEGYFGPSIAGVFQPAVTTTTTVSARQTARVTLALIPGGTINGRVVDASGKPIAEAPIGVVRRIYRGGVAALDITDGKESDDRGVYRLYRLPPGEYFVVALPKRVNGVPTSGDASAPEVPVTTFYPSAIDVTSALPIALKPGDELSGVDVQMRNAMTFTVSGHVVSMLPPGSEVSAINRQTRPNIAQLSILPRDGTVLPDIFGLTIAAQPDGTFQLTGLLSGSYDLIARLPVSTGWGPQNGPDRATSPWAFGRASIEIAGANVENVVVGVHQGMDVPGRVTVDGVGAPVAVRVTLQPDEQLAIYNNFFGTIGNYAPFLDADGSFTFPVIPESHYRVRVGLGNGPTRAPVANAQGQLPPAPVPLAAGAYVADVQQAGRSVYDEGVDVGTEPVAPIEVVIKTNGATVEGVVSRGGTPAPAGVSVVLVPDGAHRKNPALYRTGTTDQDGAYSIARVPPGSYRAFAWETLVPGAYENVEWLRPYEGRGVAVTVGGGTHATVDLNAIRLP